MIEETQIVIRWWIQFHHSVSYTLMPVLLEQIEPQETPFDKCMILGSFRKYYLVSYTFGEVWEFFMLKDIKN